MSDAAREDDPLPGFEPPRREVTELETAARRSLGALRAAGLLTDAHAVTMQLVLELARAVGRASLKGQAAAAAMAAAQLREAWAALPQIPGEALGDEWDQLARDLRGAAADERQRHAIALADQ